MAKKKSIKVNSENVDFDLEKDGVNVNANLDTKNLDVSYVKNEVDKQFKLDGKNLDIDIKKTKDGLDIKVDTSNWLWKIISKKVIRFILRKIIKRK